MKPDAVPPVKQAKGPQLCQRCGAVEAHGLHRHADMRVCESCYVDLWRPHHRKAHWCYLRSIKTGYLRKRPSE